MSDKEIKRLGDVHPDMERYLNDDCYCPFEIYDTTGFFYDIFEPDFDCVVAKETELATVVIAHGLYDEKKARPQVIYFQHADDSGRIDGTLRCDATENNVNLLKMFADGLRPEGKLDEFENGDTERALRQMSTLCDAVIVD